jgi:hypothetical protein
MRRRCLSCRHKRLKISLEVAVVHVAAPFTVVLNGNATILAPVAVDGLIMEVGCRNARQYVCLIRLVSRWWCTHS